MSKKLLYLFGLALFSFLIVSCEKGGLFDSEDTFDESLLHGKWKSGTLYYKYQPNYTGTTWDEGDDVYENEAQRFEWSLVKSELTQIHLMESSGAKIPKIYTITILTSTSLRYKDDFGKSFSFTKVN